MSIPLPTVKPDPAPGFQRALGVFHRAARQVPAYADFLAAHGVYPADIHTLADFANVPAMTKENYLHRYPLDALVWRGDITRAGTWSTSSGSTGHPTYWPRDIASLDESTELYARIFQQCFGSQRRSTLLVIGFAMGNWIGGTYTYTGALMLRRRGHRLSVIAPGIDAETILDNIATLGPRYDQVVLAGYPPFIKDVLDRASEAVLSQDLRILLAGEAISENWRDWVLRRIGKSGDPTATCLMYGTADAGIMGHETATTIAVRRLAARQRVVGTALFGADEIQPTLVEYDADYRFAELDAEQRFLFTVDTAIPLVRYRINDRGALFSAPELADLVGDNNIPITASTASCGFLALHRRTDIAASFYALKIYPDSVRMALEHPDIAPTVTGKFVLATSTGRQFEQTLTLRVELRAGTHPIEGFAVRLRRAVVDALEHTNTEYRRLHRTLGAAAEPEISLRPFASAGFEADIKHRWTERAA
ncbi:phenylacetate--CoA ligase family protein [Nocardia pseudovaccinii]|uniref:phenylacetate--CoA ligase family protein n=1 Tax=Nocardia pseudovaccinii TaxID=189540 RepID=UPI0007A51F5C|nr:phenylacetate--CoA ligase family protein [Nocardia pseudovaccinii]